MKWHVFIFLGWVLPAWADKLPPPPVQPQPPSGLVYFQTYEENQKAFVEKAGSHLFQSWGLKNHPELTTDLALYNYGSDELLVISSGLHGIEGYVGSSLQRALMENLNARKKLKTDVLLIHALNPWGMKNRRRVNEGNVDLNRNFQTTPKLYEQKNEDYLKINSFLNPTEALSLGVFHRLGFLASSIRLILQYSIETLRKSILVGQYTEEQGLYFGGKNSDDLQTRIDILAQKDFARYKKIMWIDLHTGYGARGKLHLLANDSSQATGQKMQALFPNHPMDFGNQDHFYKTDGDMVSYVIAKSTPKQDYSGITFEFGTMDSQKTLGSIESLRRMVIENQGFQRGYTGDEDKIETQALFSNMFFPQEEDWKRQVLSQTQELLNPLLQETP